MTSRWERLHELGRLHERWVGEELASASAAFNPESHPQPDSDYNLHHVDLDADAAAQDRFYAEAMDIFGDVAVLDELVVSDSPAKPPAAKRAKKAAAAESTEIAAAAKRILLAAFDRARDREPSYEDITRWARAAGADTHPGGEELKHYWTKDPEGLALWADDPHPWTALYNHLITKIENPGKTKRIVSAWYEIVFGGPVGWKKGKNPRGPG